MHNSALINIYMTDQAARLGVPRYFFSSSVCVYRDMQPGEPEMTEAEAVPAHPDNEYGWEKLYSERIAEAYERRYGMQVRIARFQNCYGPEGHVDGRPREGAGGDVPEDRRGRGRRAPSRSGATARRCGRTPTSATWSTGSTADAVRPARRGEHRLPAVRHGRRTGAGGGARRREDDQHPPRRRARSGVHSRNFSNARIYSLGWTAKVDLEAGLALTYPVDRVAGARPPGRVAR